jgi:predicted nucleic acid-binding Zn ribbon protein
MKSDYARELYKNWRAGSRKSKKSSQSDESRVRHDDPQALSSVLSELIAKRDWRQGIAEGTLFTEWSSVVGAEVGAHTTPLTLVDGLLTIQTSSTAWATQIRLIAPELLKKIAASAPGALVEELAVLGPNTPNWKKGIRTIKNSRGPRDTYG